MFISKLQGLKFQLKQIILVLQNLQTINITIMYKDL